MDPVGGVFSNTAKYALLSLLGKVAYIDEDGQEYLDTLERELFIVAVASISAVFAQGENVIGFNEDLDVLKPYLTVTATYVDGTTQVVSPASYTLSGTLQVGMSTITVTYMGKTAEFTVEVSSFEYLVRDTTGTGTDQTFTIDNINLTDGDYVECYMYYTEIPVVNDSPFRLGNNANGSGLWTYGNGYKYLIYVNPNNDNSTNSKLTFIANGNSSNGTDTTIRYSDNGKYVVKIDSNGIWLNGVLQTSNKSNYATLVTWMNSQSTLYAGVNHASKAQIEYIRVYKAG